MSSINSRVGAPWVPVLRLDEFAWLGVSGEDLYVGDQHGPKRALDLTTPIGLLPCLERPHRDVVAEVSRREAELALPAGILSGRIPLHLVPLAAVSTRMDFWVQRALDWLSEEGSSWSATELLEYIASAPWASQRAKHRAGVIIRGRETER